MSRATHDPHRHALAMTGMTTLTASSLRAGGA